MIRFAGDKTLLASLKNDFKKFMTNLDSVADGYGIKVNIKTNKIMQISKSENDMNIVLKIQILEQVHFKYRCNETTTNGRSALEVRKRIAMKKATFNIKKILLTESFNLQLKKSIVKVMVGSEVLYGYETWMLRKEEISGPEAFCDVDLEKTGEN